MRFRLLPQQSHLGWTPYAWLIYLSFYVVSAFFNSRRSHSELDKRKRRANIVLHR